MPKKPNSESGKEGALQMLMAITKKVKADKKDSKRMCKNN